MTEPAQLRDAAAIELFHLAFLRVLQARLNQDLYILKGGANLRYFFDSVRYSEDIDMDAQGIEVWELEEKVDGVIGGTALPVLLRQKGIAVGEVSKPKQSETTQRWKVGLQLPTRDDLLRTKIEFSRRNGDDRHALEAVPGRVVEPYALAAPSVRHYLGDAAVEQKVLALDERTETQARDVFDLEPLLRQNPTHATRLDSNLRERVAERALELDYHAFRDQVLNFLDPEIAELYQDAASWEQLRAFVVETLVSDDAG
jgi:predicted nucleotidyltransferase component of viral defense system